MTVVAAGPTARRDARSPRAARATAVTVAVLTLAAIAIRLYRLRGGYAHGVVGYDDGVYLGSALGLVDGRLPYRDYVFAQPPGITLLLTPDALLAKLVGTAQAMGLAKVLTGLAGAAGVPLVARLIRQRGLPAVAVACGIVAFQDDAVAAGYGVLLEPWLVLFVLIGAALVFEDGGLAGERRLCWGGLAFGFAAAVKIWALAPVLAVVLVVLAHRRPPLRFLGGVAAGFLVPVLPFACLAPGAFVHQVLTVQLLRTPDARTSLAYRLVHLFAVSPPTADEPPGFAALVVIALAFAGVLVLAWVRVGRVADALDHFAVLGTVLVVAMLLVPGTLYWHYAAFAAPFLALAMALPLGRLRARTAERRWLVAGALFALIPAGTVLGADAYGFTLRNDARQVDAIVPARACVVTNMSSSMIADDRFTPTRPDCPSPIDSFGTALAAADGRAPSVASLQTPALRALWARAYRHADFVYLVHRDSPLVPADPARHRYLVTHFHRVQVGGLAGRLYARDR